MYAVGSVNIERVRCGMMLLLYGASITLGLQTGYSDKNVSQVAGDVKKKAVEYKRKLIGY